MESKSNIVYDPLRNQYYSLITGKWSDAIPVGADGEITLRFIADYRPDTNSGTIVYLLHDAFLGAEITAVAEQSDGFAGDEIELGSGTTATFALQADASLQISNLALADGQNSIGLEWSFAAVSSTNKRYFAAEPTERDWITIDLLASGQSLLFHAGGNAFDENNYVRVEANNDSESTESVTRVFAGKHVNYRLFVNGDNGFALQVSRPDSTKITPATYTVIEDVDAFEFDASALNIAHFQSVEETEVANTAPPAGTFTLDYFAEGQAGAVDLAVADLVDGSVSDDEGDDLIAASIENVADGLEVVLSDDGAFFTIRITELNLSGDHSFEFVLSDGAAISTAVSTVNIDLQSRQTTSPEIELIAGETHVVSASHHHMEETAQTHSGMLKLMPLLGEPGSSTVLPTHQARLDGNPGEALDWFDPMTWGGQEGDYGIIPGQGAMVHIPIGVQVTYNAASAHYSNWGSHAGVSSSDELPKLFMIRVDGALSFEASEGSVNTALKVDTLFGTHTSAITAGPEASGNVDISFVPYDINADDTLPSYYSDGVIKNDIDDGAGVLGRYEWDPEQLSLGFISNGEIDFEGHDKIEHTKGATASQISYLDDNDYDNVNNAGSSYIAINLADVILPSVEGISPADILAGMGWAQGDQLLVGGTKLMQGSYIHDTHPFKKSVRTESEVVTLERAADVVWIENNAVLIVEIGQELKHSHRIHNSIFDGIPRRGSNFNDKEAEAALRDQFAPSIANLSRNITLRSEVATDQPEDKPPVVHGTPIALMDLAPPETGFEHDHFVTERGHLMFMHTDDVNFKNVSVLGFGRTDKSSVIDQYKLANEATGERAQESGEDVLAAPEDVLNMRGRYSVHLHKAGVNSENYANIEGISVWGSPGWAIAQHDSNANLTDNVTFDILGSAYNTETGNEMGVWNHNLSVDTDHASQFWNELRIKDPEDITYSPDDYLFLERLGPAEKQHAETNHDFGFTGTGFWMEGHLVRLENNIAVNSHEAGYWLSYSGRDAIPVETSTLEYDGVMLERNGLVNGEITPSHAVPSIAFMSGNESVASIYGLYLAGDRFDSSESNQNDFRVQIDDTLIWEFDQYGAFIWDSRRLEISDFTAVGSGDVFKDRTFPDDDADNAGMMSSPMGHLFGAIAFYKRTNDAVIRDITYDNAAAGFVVGKDGRAVDGGVVLDNRDQYSSHRANKRDTRQGLEEYSEKSVNGYRQIEVNGQTYNAPPPAVEIFDNDVALDPNNGEYAVINTWQSYELKIGGAYLKHGNLSYADASIQRTIHDMMGAPSSAAPDQLVDYNITASQGIGKQGTEVQVDWAILPWFTTAHKPVEDAGILGDEFHVAIGGFSEHAAYFSNSPSEKLLQPARLSKNTNSLSENGTIIIDETDFNDDFSLAEVVYQQMFKESAQDYLYRLTEKGIAIGEPENQRDLVASAVNNVMLEQIKQVDESRLKDPAGVVVSNVSLRVEHLADHLANFSDLTGDERVQALLEFRATDAIAVNGYKYDAYGATYAGFAGDYNVAGMRRGTGSEKFGTVDGESISAGDRAKFYKEGFWYSYDRLAYAAAKNGYYLVDHEDREDTLQEVIVIVNETFVDRKVREDESYTQYQVNIPVSLGFLESEATMTFLEIANEVHNDGHAHGVTLNGAFNTFALDQNAAVAAGAAEVSVTDADYTIDIDGMVTQTRSASSPLDTHFEGTAEDDVIISNFGNDTLSDGYGSDVLIGGSGENRFVLAPDAEEDIILNFEAGADIIDITSWGAIVLDNFEAIASDYRSYAFSYQDQTLSLQLSSESSLLDLNTLEQYFEMQLSDGIVSGTSGDDRIDANYTLDPEGDLVTSGPDTIEAGAGNDTVFAGAGDDFIFGGSGTNDLVGGDGNDTIYTGVGSGRFYGQQGEDVFVLENGGTGRIMDFVFDDDKIDVSDWGVTSFDLLDLTNRYTGHGEPTSQVFLSDTIGGGNIIRVYTPGSEESADEFTAEHFLFG